MRVLVGSKITDFELDNSPAGSVFTYRMDGMLHKDLVVTNVRCADGTWHSIWGGEGYTDASGFGSGTDRHVAVRHIDPGLRLVLFIPEDRLET